MKAKESFGVNSFLHEVNPGDTVFHYDKKVRAITGSSVATGVTWEDVITWAAHGTYARAAGTQPHLRDGLYLGLERYALLTEPVTLDQIRLASSTIEERLEKLKRSVSGPLYYPFERGKKRATRPMQGYLFKLPSFFL